MKKRVQLHAQNRGVEVETDATVGAVVGENLFFADGTLVTEEMLSNVGVATPSNPEAEVAPAQDGGPSSPGGVADGGPVYWRSLMEVPENLEALADLTGTGVLRRTGDFTFDLATTTTDVPEGAGLYFTAERAIAAVRRMTLVAGISISALRMICANAGSGSYPDTSISADAGKVVGMSITSATLGDAFEVITGGEWVDAGWSWVPGIVWCDNAGVLTQTPPAGWVLEVGRAVSATRIILDVKTPLLRN